MNNFTAQFCDMTNFKKQCTVPVTFTYEVNIC